MWRKNSILTVVLFHLFVKINGQGEQCYSPSGTIGLCAVLPQCPSLVYYYGRNQRNSQVINYLLTAQRNCGTRRIGNNPIVCCDNPTTNRPTESPYQPQPEVPPEEPVPQPPVTQPPTPRTTTQPPTVAPTDSQRIAGKSCQDPNGLNGVCTNIRECPSILNEFVARSNDQRYVQYVKRSNGNCGNVQQLICCPDEGKSEKTPSTSEPAIIIPIEPDTTPTEIQGRLLTDKEGCGYTSVGHTRVVGGKNAQKSGWPWMALLGYENNFGERSWKCGGSLITTRHVLSAAHCVISTLSLARLGEHDISSTSDGSVQDIKIIRSVKHPDYDKRDGTSDISVLYLEQDAKLSLEVKPICIPINDPYRSRSFTDHTPFVAGWGRLQEGGKSSNVLQELQLPILSNDICRDRYQKQGRLLSGKQFGKQVICAGNLQGGQDSCQGDSGGPLMQPILYDSSKNEFRFYQIGVVSYGIGCARTDVPGVYTSVQHFADWIQDKVNE